jgi:hypothetical protein
VRAVIGALAALALVVGATSTARAADWLSPVRVSAPTVTNASNPDIAVASNGTVAALWREGSVIVGAIRPPGGPFGAPQTLDSDGATDTAPKVAISPAGAAIAVWRTSGGLIKESLRPANGSFATAGLLGSSANSDPAVAVGAYGISAVAWSTDANVHVIVTRPDNSIDDVQDFAVAGGADTISVAVNDQLKPAIAVTWSNGNIQGRVRNSQGVWQSLTAAMGVGINPVASVDLLGNATAVWNGGGDVEWAGGTSFPSSHQVLSSTPTDAAPDLATNAAGLTVAVFRDSAQQQIDIATRVGSRDFPLVPSAFSPAGQQDTDPTVSVNPLGSVFGGWTRTDTTPHAVQGTILGGGVKTVSSGAGDASSPVISSDGLGNGAIVFIESGRAFVTGFDGAPPTLNSVSVPPITPSGSAVSMAAAPFDTWTAPTVSWNFGDGQSSPGATTSHVYTKTGIYTVTVNAADGVGNATSTTRQIAVVFPDRDHDGFPSNLDCNDNNPKVHPGAHDIPHNKIDENCNGRDAKFPKVDATISYGFLPAGPGRFRLTQLLIKSANRHETATVRCSGKPKCSFKKPKRGAKARKGRINLLKKLSARQRVIHAGQTLDIRVTRRGYIGKVLQVKFRARKNPVTRNRCLEPGSKRLRNRCS